MSLNKRLLKTEHQPLIIALSFWDFGFYIFDQNVVSLMFLRADPKESSFPNPDRPILKQRGRWMENVFLTTKQTIWDEQIKSDQLGSNIESLNLWISSFSKSRPLSSFEINRGRSFDFDEKERMKEKKRWNININININRFIQLSNHIHKITRLSRFDDQPDVDLHRLWGDIRHRGWSTSTSTSSSPSSRFENRWKFIPDDDVDDVDDNFAEEDEDIDLLNPEMDRVDVKYKCRFLKVKLKILEILIFLSWMDDQWSH
jgi:hypothetical protein